MSKKDDDVGVFGVIGFFVVLFLIWLAGSIGFIEDAMVVPLAIVSIVIWFISMWFIDTQTKIGK